MAVVATDAEIKVATHNLAVKERKSVRQEEQLRSYADKLQGQRLVFTARAGEQGRLYGSITAADIAEELARKVGEDVDRRRIQLDEPLRSIGEHNVTIHVVGRLRPQITVVIEDEKTEEAPEAAAAEAETPVEAEVEAEA
jgi:large subunit ribosomal protein L9